MASVVAIVGAGALLVMRGSGAVPEPSHRLTGRLDLVQGKPGQPPSFATTAEVGSCAGVGDFRDVRLGMPVSVESLDGILLGQAWLDDGEIAPGADSTTSVCSFRFSGDVRPAASYRIVPGTRDAIKLSLDELQASGWTVVVTIRP